MNRDKVNIFWGSEIFNSKEKGTLAPKWFFYKPQIGNLGPACTLPNSPFTVVPYSGGYPTGYGIYNPSYASVPSVMSEKKTIKGFTHFSHSGCGFLENFYNYFMVSPSGGEKEEIKREDGGCAWYSTEAESYKARVSLSSYAASYEIETKGNKTITIKPYYGGLLNDNKRCTLHHFPYEMEERNKSLLFTVNADGVPLYFTFSSLSPFTYKRVDDDILVDFPSSSITFSVSYSLSSLDNAASRISLKSFEETRKEGEKNWDNELESINFKGSDEEERLFYSTLYSALKKPCFDDFNPPVFDIGTMWDIYKTLLPSLFILYPQKGERILNGFASCFKNGRFANSVFMDRDFNTGNQALCLMSISIATGYLYGLNADWDTLLSMAKTELENYAQKSKFFRPYITHNLDFLDAYYALSSCGIKFSKEVEEGVKSRENKLYDKDELLIGGFRTKYYEGSRWNYSYRVSSSVFSRLERANLTILEKNLDSFFGFGEDEVPLFREPMAYKPILREGRKYNRFEGLNNEPDMESMYFYHLLSHYDKTQEILDEIMEVNFHSGPDGFPGNDDSGGISGWLVLNMLGLFPIVGTPIILLGSPHLDEAEIREYNLKIQTKGREKGKKIKSITLNEKPILERMIDIKELKKGGVLIFNY